MVVVMVMVRGGGGPVNGNNDTELLSVMCAAASTITSTGPGLDTGILLFRNCEKIHCRPRPRCWLPEWGGLARPGPTQGSCGLLNS